MCSTRSANLKKNKSSIQTSWYLRPNPEDQINKKLDDRKNDQATKKGKKNIRPNSTVLNLIIRSSGFTNQLSLNGYIGTNIKGRVLQIMGNLPFELANASDRY